MPEIIRYYIKAFKGRKSPPSIHGLTPMAVGTITSGFWDDNVAEENGFILCDGRVITQKEYPELFEVLRDTDFNKKRYRITFKHWFFKSVQHFDNPFYNKACFIPDHRPMSMMT